MKILLITDNHNPQGGGAEKSFFALKKILQQQAHLTVHSLGFGPNKAIGSDYTILKETPLKPLRLLWRIILNPLKYMELKRAIAKVKPDIIHLHNIRKYTISLLHAVKNQKVIHTMHDYTAICPTGWNVHENLEPCATGLRLACFWRHKRTLNPFIYLGLLVAFLRTQHLLKQTVKYFLTPSELLQSYLTQNHFIPAQTITPFLPENKLLSFANLQQNRFLFVGQLGKHKGVDYLIEEFAIAYQQNSALKLDIVGCGPEAKKLQVKVKKFQLEKNIFFHGWREAQAFYSTATAVIFPSIGLESFGLVITEAMANGRAVIASKRGPSLQLIDDKKSGLLFDPLKLGDLAEKITLLAENTSFAETLGRAAYQKLEQLDSNQTSLEKIIAVYQ